MSQFIENGIRYENIDDETVKVLGFGINCEKNGIVIPEMIRGYSVVAISDKAFENIKILRKVFLPKTIMKIGKQSFMNCFQLEEVHIDGLITDFTLEIDEKAFKDCFRLRILDCQRKVSLIGSSIFYGCKTLNNIWLTFINEIPENSFKSCISLSFFIFEDLMTVSDSAFDNCLSLNKLSFYSEIIATSEFFSKIKHCLILCSQSSPYVNLAFEGYNVKIIE